MITKMEEQLKQKGDEAGKIIESQPAKRLTGEYDIPSLPSAV